MNWKKLLIERLGNKCRVCGQENIEKLDIHFINGQEYLENQYFEKKMKCMFGLFYILKRNRISISDL